jgi:RsiW-degrading membrane proteinase PrsW (M82 family)
MTNNFQIQLSWQDPVTGEQRTPRLSLPIAFGRAFAQMPVELNGRRVARMLLNHNQVSRYHTLIDLEQNHLVVIDQGTANGTFVNNQSQTRHILADGDTLQIGPYVITATFDASAIPHDPSNDPTISSFQHHSHRLSVSEIFPVVSKKLDLHQHGFLVPGIITVIFVVAMIFTRQINQLLFLYILAAYLASASHYLIHKLCHKHKPWWLLVSLALATGLPLLSDLHHLFIVSKEDTILTVIFKVFPAELFKGLPILLVYVLGRLLASPKRELIGIWEPIDGILLGTASATGFALVETMMHVHEEVAATGDFFNAITLLIPQILGDISGQVAYSGYFGYFIGLSALKPTKRWQLLGIGYLTATSMHAVWALVILFQEKQHSDPFGSIFLAVIGVAIASLAYAFLMGAILKARQLSPKHLHKLPTHH